MPFFYKKWHQNSNSVKWEPSEPNRFGGSRIAFMLLFTLHQIVTNYIWIRYMYSLAQSYSTQNVETWRGEMSMSDEGRRQSFHPKLLNLISWCFGFSYVWRCPPFLMLLIHFTGHDISCKNLLEKWHQAEVLKAFGRVHWRLNWCISLIAG